MGEAQFSLQRQPQKRHLLGEFGNILPQNFFARIAVLVSFSETNALPVPQIRFVTKHLSPFGHIATPSCILVHRQWTGH